MEISKIDLAYRAVMEAGTVDEVKEIRDKAEALRQYAKQQSLGLEAQNAWAEIKLRAERRAGALLAEMPRSNGGRPEHIDGNLYHDDINKHLYEVLKENEISVPVAYRWQTIARLPDEVFEQEIAETKAKGQELTTTKILQAAARQRAPEPAITPALPQGKYRCVVIDPPWPMKKIEREERPNQGAELDYPTMTVKEIEALPIKELADETGCHLYLWVTQKYLPDGLRIIETWGFRYQCLMTWCKNVGITPFSWMYDTEHVIFARSGNLPLQKLGLRLSFEAPVTDHSAKPDIFYNDRVIPASLGPRLEMFARKERSGFYAWGNEV